VPRSQRRQPCSVTRPRTPHSDLCLRMTRSESPAPRLRCKSPDFGGNTGSNRHPSPNPPKVRTNDSQPVTLSGSTPPPAAPSTQEPGSQLVPQDSVSPISPSLASPILCSPVLQILPHDIPDFTTHHGETLQHFSLPPEHRFRQGHVYRRRPCVPHPEAQPRGGGQIMRFCLGLVYSKHRTRGPSTSSLR
jgi:hypothetical protein